MDSVGEYQIVRPLGVGGMAETFLALRRRGDGFEQSVCLKRILPAFARNPLYRKLFVEEARLAAKLRHSNIVGVIDYASSAHELYLVFELIAGCDLRSILRAQPTRRLSPDLTLLIATELARGLRHAHRQNIVHRDLSPSNVLVSIDGEVKLADFGIAKAMNTTTHSGVVKGKVQYMSPEQARAIKVDGRADLFSLGAMMYECLLGRRPFDGASEVETLTRVLESKFVRLREVENADIPDGLRRIVDRLLAHEREDRYPDAGELLKALHEITPGPGAREELGALAREIHDPAKISTSPGEDAHQANADGSSADFEKGRTLKDAVHEKEKVAQALAHGRTLEDISPTFLPTEAAGVEPVPLPSADLPVPAPPDAPTRTKLRPPEAVASLRDAPANARTRAETPSSKNAMRRRLALAALGSALVVAAVYGWRANESQTQPVERPPETRADHERPSIEVPPPTAPEDPMPPTDEAHAESSPSESGPDEPEVEQADPEQVDPEQVDPQPEAPQEPEDALATLTVVVLPFGDVWVDGRHVGSTPARLRLEPGVHSIEAGTDADRVRRSVRLAAGQRRRVTINRRAR